VRAVVLDNGGVGGAEFMSGSPAQRMRTPSTLAGVLCRIAHSRA